VIGIALTHIVLARLVSEGFAASWFPCWHVQISSWCRLEPKTLRTKVGTHAWM